MSDINTTTLSDAVKTAYEMRLLTRAIPRYVHGRWAMKARISKRGTYELRKYGSLSAVSVALGEGVTPAETQSPTPTLITMTPAFYGAWMGFTELAELQVIDPIISEMSSILGEQAGLTADTLVRNELVTDSTIDYSGGQSAVGTLESPAHDISYVDIIKQYAALEASSALPIDGEDFIVILHPHSYASLMLDPTFVNMMIQEAPNTAMRNGYIGRLLRMKIYVSSNAYEWADVGVGSTTDVYAALFIAKESYGILGLTGIEEPKDVDSQGPDGRPLTGQKINPVEIILKQVGSAGSADPLNQRGSLAWKMTLTTEVLNADWIRCLKHTNYFSNL
ncbi:N4-gp56 family major capsid protein [Candidatus Dojkabacteria bacterium]|nr:N4-gp56 family major capsid protein [Candidatus Dojkabacteria bacterium]